MFGKVTLVRKALGFVTCLGFVSLFADLTYEGARAITGPYLALLGATSLAVGVSSGLGEFAGYALRLFTGFVADRTRRYWTFTFLGYLINLGAVPALALAGSWKGAVALIVAERFGKALRTPARDALLAQATEPLGHGKGFGLHELLDQIGAVAGPLVVASFLFHGKPVRFAFLFLAIPAVAALATLVMAFALSPGAGPSPAPGENLHFRLAAVPPWLLAFVSLHLLGFGHFQLIAYHCQQQGVFAPATIPLLFALAMGVDGAVALPAGAIFDRLGLGSIALAAALALPVPALVFSTHPTAVVVGVTLWGAALALQETVLKAAVVATCPQNHRATAFGVFHFFSGIAWLLSGSLFGTLYQWGYKTLILAAAISQLLALGVLAKGIRKPPRVAPFSS